jgi:hypothetical protein
MYVQSQDYELLKEDDILFKDIYDVYDSESQQDSMIIEDCLMHYRTERVEEIEEAHQWRDAEVSSKSTRSTTAELEDRYRQEYENSNHDDTTTLYQAFESGGPNYIVLVCVHGNGDSTGKDDAHDPFSSMVIKFFDELRRFFLKERLREFLRRQRALRQEKSLGRNSSAPLDVRWLEFQSLLLLAYGDVERNPGPLTRKSTLCYTLIVLGTKTPQKLL